VITSTGLDFFADGHFTARYEELGFYSSADFIELGGLFGVPEKMVREMMRVFPDRQARIERAVVESRLSEEAKAGYLDRFRDRLRAIVQ